MRKIIAHVVFAAFGLAAVLPAGQAAAFSGHFRLAAPPIVAVQYYGEAPQYGAPQYGAPQYGAPQYGAPREYGPPRDWQRCNWLRRRAREVEYRLSNAPPWEQPRLHQRLESLRREAWETCRR